MSVNPLSLISPTMGIIRLIVLFIFMVGCTRGAILLLIDSVKHKGFAKIIRIICAAVRFLVLLFSIIDSLGKTSMSNQYLGMLLLITSIRGGVLLLVESGRVKHLAKAIRIICGILMIGLILLSIILAIVISAAIMSSLGI